MNVVRRKDIAHSLKQRIGFSERSCNAFIRDFFQEVSNLLSRGHSVSFRRIGTFEVYQGKERIARDLKKASPLLLPARPCIRFVPSKTLKKSIQKQKTS